MKIKNIIDSFLAFALAVLLNILFVFYMEEKLGLFATAIAEVLILIPAVLFVFFRKQDSIERFSLKLPSIRDFFAAAVLYFGATVIQNALSYLLYPLFYKNMPTDTAYTDKLFEGFSPFVILICVAVIPAVCQELLFRGYLRTAFPDNKKQFSVLSVIIPAILYASAHMSIYQLPIKLIMGLALGYIALKTSSVLLPIIFHFISSSNTLINYFSQKNADASSEVLSLKDSSYYIMAVIALTAGALLVFAGFRLFAKTRLSLLKKIVPSVTALIICFICVLLLFANETGTLLNVSGRCDIGSGKTITEEFTVDRNTNCSFNGVFSFDEGIDVTLVVKDEEGETLYEYTTSSNQGFMLEKGKYTLDIIFTAEEDAPDTMVSYRIQLTGFGGFEAIGS